MADIKSINALNNNQSNENTVVGDESDILGMELHPNARDRIKEHVDHFSRLLLIQAKTLAFSDNADIVSSSHVDKALELAISEKKRRKLKEVFKILGGAFIGAFVSGFYNSLTANEPLAIVFYVALVLTGVTLVFLGIL
jgi:hypothetical protein